MKGTLFSADFVKDSTGNLRLLELNTDTGFLTQEVSNIDFTDINQVLVENNITVLDIIYKPGIHLEFVNNFSASVPSNITTINLHEEDPNSIYPITIEDSSDKFILRLAYDESALFDSEYCKNRLNVFNLFTDNSVTDYCVSYYHSSSIGEFNTLTKELNENNLPDATIKDINEYHNPIDFFKIGSEVENETIEDRWNQFLSANVSDDKVIEQYHFHTSSLDSYNHITSVRFFGIVYGSELEVIPLHSYKISSIFDLPNDLSSELNLSQYTNKIQDYHYYEFTTNFIKSDSNGLLSTHEILSSDDVWRPIGDYVVGNSVKSYHIDRYDASNQNSLYFNYEGSQLPSGSYLTSSVVVYKDSANLKYNSMFELKVDNDSFFSGLSKYYIVFDSGSNMSSFKPISLINPETDYLYGVDANLINIDEINFYTSTDSNLTYVELDIEDTDTFIISGSTSFNTIVAHNAPCFVAGTQILLENELTKNIEDVVEGEYVVSFDFKNNQLVPSKVLKVFSRKVDKVVEYEFVNGTKLKATLDHPIYVIDKGWCSYSDELSNSLYKLNNPVQKIELNDIVKFNNEDSELKNITILNEENVVYNLSEIDTFHNYFVNGVLAHNRGTTTTTPLPFCFIAGTQVSIADGSEKNIEDVVIGEEVLSYNEETGVIEPKQVIKLNSPIHDDLVEYTLSNGIKITSTFDHPYYINGLQLASYQPNWTNERYDLPSEVGKIKVGDFVNLANKETVEIISIAELDRIDTQTYIISVEDNRNFYANQILVHNK
jgi:intein/homing endonuclease